MRAAAVVVLVCLACHAEAWLFDWAFRSAPVERNEERPTRKAPVEREEELPTRKASVLHKKRRRLDGHICENTAGWFKCAIVLPCMMLATGSVRRRKTAHGWVPCQVLGAACFAGTLEPRVGTGPLRCTRALCRATRASWKTWSKT